MKTIHPAIAEHVMEENERLRGLLREIAEGCTRRDMPSEQTVTKWADRIDAALSQQAEPAPAQDERDAVARDVEMLGVGFMVGGVRVSPDRVTVHYATRPAQTEQQPVAWMYRGTVVGDRLSFQCLNHYWRPKFGGAEHEYVAGIPLYAAPIAQTAPQTEQSGLTDDGKEAAMQKAFELGGLEDGSYHLESDELELVIRTALSTQGDKP